MSARSVIAKRTAATTTTKSGVPGSIGSVANANVRRPPYASIQSQVAFSQAQQQQPQPQQSQGFNLQQQQQLNQPPRKVGLQRPQQQQPQQPQQMQPPAWSGASQQQQQIPIPNKLSIGNAFALTTIRLGKVEEQIIDLNQQMQSIYEQGLGIGIEEGETNRIGHNTLSMEERANFVGKDIHEGLVKKVELMDKMVKDSMLNMQKLLKENQQLKQSLITVTNHLNKHITDTTNKFTETENFIYQLENNLQSLQYIEEQPELIEGNENNLDNFNGQGQTFLSENSVHDPSLFSVANPLMDTENNSFPFPDMSSSTSSSFPTDTIQTMDLSNTSLLDNDNSSIASTSLLFDDTKKKHDPKKRPPPITL